MAAAVALQEFERAGVTMAVVAAPGTHDPAKIMAVAERTLLVGILGH